MNEQKHTTIWGSPTYAMFILWLLTIVVFFPVLEADYVDFDEHERILANPLVTAPLSLNSLSAIFTSFEANQYTPLSMASHWLEYNVTGFNSAVSHLVSLLLHILAVTAVFFLSTAMCRSLFTGFIIAAIWGLHPMQVDSVAWVLERRNLLYGAFLFLSMNSWQQYIDTRKSLNRHLAAVFMLISGLSKTLAFMIPFFWLLQDYVKARKASFTLVREKTVGLILAVILVILLFAGAWDGIPKNQSRSLHWQNSAWAISFYVAKTFLPVGLTATFEENASTIGMFAVGPVYLIFVMAIFAYLGFKCRLAAVGAIFYLCTIIPVSGLVRVGYSFYVSCHFVYVPLWGICLLAAVVFRRLFLAYAARKSGLIAALISLIVFVIISHSHVPVWNNTISLFEHSVAVDPLGRFARNQLAGAYLKASDLDRAQKHYSELARIYPEFFSGYNGLAMIAVRRGDKALARQMFDKALQIKPNEPVILMNRALLKKSEQDYEGAEADFTSSLLVTPENWKTRFLRADLLALQGKYHRAIEDLVNLMIAAPHNSFIRLNLFLLFVESADYYNAAIIALELSKGRIEQADFNAVCQSDFNVFLLKMLPFRRLIQHNIGLNLF